MTREELREHCERQIENCETWARYNREEPHGKVYEEHKLILELLEPRWISVKERLPRKEGDYLVTVRNKEYGFQYIDITTYEHSEWGYKDEWQVIAWMNAPSEYKEESEDKE